MKGSRLVWQLYSVSIPQASFNERLFEMRHGIIMSALAIGLFALALGYIRADHFTKPLVHMTHVASRMAEGDYDQRYFLTMRVGHSKVKKARYTVSRKALIDQSFVNQF